MIREEWRKFVGGVLVDIYVRTNGRGKEFNWPILYAEMVERITVRITKKYPEIPPAERDSKIAEEVGQITGNDKEGNAFPDEAHLIDAGYKLTVETLFDSATQKLGAYKEADDGQHVDREIIELTNDEIASNTLLSWEMEMSRSDSEMNRDIEDIWDVIGISKAPQVTQDRHATKKALRAQKP